MQRFAAKRYVVRQALLDLERIGIVVRSPNRGAAVRDFTVEEVEEIAEVRETLHRRAVQRMRLPADATLIKALQAAQRRHDTAVAARDPSAMTSPTKRFMPCCLVRASNKLLAGAIAHYAYLSRAMRLYPLVDPALLETLRKSIGR